MTLEVLNLSNCRASDAQVEGVIMVAAALPGLGSPSARQEGADGALGSQTGQTGAGAGGLWAGCGPPL